MPRRRGLHFSNGNFEIIPANDEHWPGPRPTRPQQTRIEKTSASQVRKVPRNIYRIMNRLEREGSGEAKESTSGPSHTPAMAQKVAKFENKIIKTEKKKAQLALTAAKADKKADKNKSSPSVEPTADGHYELNPLMSQVLDDELQRIMIKVWQALPDEPPTEAEKLVADTFRNEAGDELRNVLGLNVTKRILHVYNPLYLKVEFNEKPSGQQFQNFLKWLDCTGMKKIEDGPFTYCAQVYKIRSFDRACHIKSVRFGTLRATFTPHYNYRQCPSKLNTLYKENKKEKNIDKWNCYKENAKDSAPEKKPAANVTVDKTDSTETKKVAEINQKTTEANEDNKTPVKSNAVKPTVNTQVTNNTQQKVAATTKIAPQKPTESQPTTTLKEKLNKTELPGKDIPNVDKTVTVKQTPNAVKTVTTKQDTNVAKTVTGKETANVVKTVASTQNTNVAKKVPAKQTPGVVKTVATKQNPNVAKTVAAKETPTVVNTVATQQNPNVAKAVTAKETPGVAKTTTTKQNPNRAKTVKENSTAVKTVATKQSAGVVKTVASPKTENAPKDNADTKPAIVENVKSTPKKITPNKNAEVIVAAKKSPIKHVTFADPENVNKVNTSVKPAVAKSAPTKVTPNKSVKVPVTAIVNKANTGTKPVAKCTTAKVTSNKIDNFEKGKLTVGNKNSDFDELDDEDILALMSDAIVLDECSGSEDES